MVIRFYARIIEKNIFKSNHTMNSLHRVSNIRLVFFTNFPITMYQNSQYLKRSNLFVIHKVVDCMMFLVFACYWPQNIWLRKWGENIKFSREWNYSISVTPFPERERERYAYLNLQITRICLTQSTQRSSMHLNRN